MGGGGGEAGRGVKTNVLHSLRYRYTHIGIGYYMPTLRLKLRSYIQHVGYEHDYKSVNNFFASFFIYNFSSRFRRWIRRIECPWPKGYGCLDKQTVFFFFFFHSVLKSPHEFHLVYTFYTCLTRLGSFRNRMEKSAE